MWSILENIPKILEKMCDLLLLNEMLYKYQLSPAHLKNLEKEKQTKSKVSRRKEIIEIRAEINEIGTRETIAKINETKRWFFGKIR